ncbi:hypothetical protein NDU88_004506 [Pleurodeles waltl]|uniref:Uncharacterized protein n=1 Tax=Pleurodeles waltl TaxID=8319 RepID=A0AAV7PCQ0_PLEWA|nr:hypothetical protein NDU88_004506 [Pleurodeles waltl]
MHLFLGYQIVIARASNNGDPFKLSSYSITNSLSAAAETQVRFSVELPCLLCAVERACREGSSSSLLESKHV